MSTEQESSSTGAARGAQRDVRKSRLLLLGALVIAGAAFAYLSFGDIGDNLIYYWSPSELEAAEDDAIGASVRLGGLVAPGSIVYGDDGLTLDFAVTDGETTVPVHANAVPPAMFREGIGVVIEGTMRHDGRFESSRLMVKHDNEYRAPDTPDERSMDELIKTLQFDRSNT